MNLLDNDNRRLHVRLGLVVAFTIGSVAWLLHTLTRSEAGASADGKPPANVHAKRAYSGDKIKVEPLEAGAPSGRDAKLLYAGIRAPIETEPLFEESKRRNAELVEGKDLRLRFDENAHDAKGRLLAYAFLDDQFINEIQIREGLAFARLTGTTRRFADRLLAAQREARQERRGIWAQRRRSTEPQYPADPKYGNFHRPSCKEVPNIKPERLVTFATGDEAYDKGYAPCIHCSP